MSRIVERSTDNGRTWAPTQYGSRSVLAHVIQGLDPYEIHDDGVGNLYRWRPSEEGEE